MAVASLSAPPGGPNGSRRVRLFVQAALSVGDERVARCGTHRDLAAVVPELRAMGLDRELHQPCGNFLIADGRDAHQRRSRTTKPPASALTSR